MYHVITATADYASHILGLCISGTVHSVYKKTINIQLGQHLLALQSAASPLSPISLITDMEGRSMDQLPIRPGQPVNVLGDRIEIVMPDSASAGCSSSFLYQPEEIYESRLASLPPGFSHARLCERLHSVLSASDVGGFCLLSDSYKGSAEPFDLILETARKRMSSCMLLLKEGQYENAASTLAGLLGLGIGLTPSGDDFLCGVLAGLLLRNQGSHPFTLELGCQIRARLANTNEISRAFLDCALASHFSRAVISLTLLPPSGDILKSFSEIGHSSGMDTLSGIVYALELKLDQ